VKSLRSCTFSINNFKTVFGVNNGFAIYGSVKAENLNGFSTDSDYSTESILTQGVPISAVSDFTMISKTKDTVYFSWTLLSDNTGKGFSDITQYIININGTDYSTPFPGSSQTGSVTGLNPKTEYTFLIYPMNIFGRGLLNSSSLTFSTFAVPEQIG